MNVGVETQCLERSLHRTRATPTAALGVATSTVARRVEAFERALGRLLVLRGNGGTAIDADALSLPGTHAGSRRGVAARGSCPARGAVDVFLAFHCDARKTPRVRVSENRGRDPTRARVNYGRMAASGTASAGAAALIMSMSIRGSALPSAPKSRSILVRLSVQSIQL
jgi:hypothetical protein